MYLSHNPRVRFVGPGRPGLGDLSLSSIGSALTDALNRALANATIAIDSLQGKVGSTEKAQIDAANIAAIAHAAGVNNPNVPHSPALDAQYQATAKQAVEQYKNDVAVVYAQNETQASQANLSKLFLFGAAGLGIYLVATR